MITWLKERKRSRQVQIDLGVESGLLLNNSVFKAAMEDIENHYCEMWKAESSQKNREKIWLTIQNLRRLKVTIDSYYGDYETIKKNTEIDIRNGLKKRL